LCQLDSFFLHFFLALSFPGRVLPSLFSLPLAELFRRLSKNLGGIFEKRKSALIDSKQSIFIGKSAISAHLGDLCWNSCFLANLSSAFRPVSSLTIIPFFHEKKAKTTTIFHEKTAIFYEKEAEKCDKFSPRK
jgi:hypothetical protein